MTSKGKKKVPAADTPKAVCGNVCLALYLSVTHRESWVFISWMVNGHLLRQNTCAMGNAWWQGELVYVIYFFRGGRCQQIIDDR